MIKYILIIIMLCLAGCAGDTKIEVNIEKHDVSKDMLMTLCGSPLGCALIEVDTGICDIYMLPQDEYYNDSLYLLVLGHEMDHCIKQQHGVETMFDWRELEEAMCGL